MLMYTNKSRHAENKVAYAAHPGVGFEINARDTVESKKALGDERSTALMIHRQLPGNETRNMEYCLQLKVGMEVDLVISKRLFAFNGISCVDFETHPWMGCVSNFVLRMPAFVGIHQHGSV